MIIIKSDSEIELMRESGKVTGYILKELENVIRPGLSTADINHFVEKTIRGAGMIPTFLGCMAATRKLLRQLEKLSPRERWRRVSKQYASTEADSSITEE